VTSKSASDQDPFPRTKRGRRAPPRHAVVDFISSTTTSLLGGLLDVQLTGLLWIAGWFGHTVSAPLLDGLRSVLYFAFYVMAIAACLSMLSSLLDTPDIKDTVMALIPDQLNLIKLPIDAALTAIQVVVHVVVAIVKVLGTPYDGSKDIWNEILMATSSAMSLLFKTTP
jgi:hypothetical protein